MNKYLLLAAFVSAAAVAQTGPSAAPPRTPDEDVNSAAIRQRAGLQPGENLLFNGWGVTPAGDQLKISDMPLKMILSPDKETIIAVSGGFNNQGVSLLDVKTHQLVQFLPLAECWNGVAFSRDGKRLFVSGGDLGVIHVFEYTHAHAKPLPDVKVAREGAPIFLAGITVHATTGKLYVCNEANQEVCVLDGETLALEKTIPVGPFPHSCLLGGDRRHLYVSNWGGSSVSIIDTNTNRKLREMSVGIRPNDMALAPDGRLFVACAGDNSVHVIPTGRLEAAPVAADSSRRLWDGAREVLSTSLYPQSLEGSTPDALAISPDGKTLFVANADNNDVMVVDISNRVTEEAREKGDYVSLVNGFIPVGWYPTSLIVSPDNGTLIVGNGKGLHSRANFPPRTKLPEGPRAKAHEHIGRTLEGSISFIPRPDNAQMTSYTAQVRRNSPYTPEDLKQAPLPSDTAIPARVGDPSPIKYVLYIIKENRTYDQVLGDLVDANGKPLGRGEPKLTIFGEPVTPNQHQFAREYVLFDNLYCNGEVSVDGHSWCDAAIATDFNERSWIMSYSKHGKLPGNDEMETPANGYLWDLCRRHGVTYRNYGEGAQRVPSANRGKWQRAWELRDMDRAQLWIDDLHKAEKTGELPRFTIMSLGENHTRGTTPGANTPNACVGSNDLGLGKIVEAASRSRFWKEMAIFVIEDDAQNGPDHIDAHRTTGFVISPYVKRGSIDSTLYTTASMVRTMELILGLPPLTQYDAGATPMFRAFQREPVMTPYTVKQPQVDLMAKNKAGAPFAKQSAKMDFSEYDRAPEDELNRILWYNAKPDVAYAAPIHRAVFTK